MTNWTPSTMGEKGGRLGKRKLNREQSLEMIRLREAKRAGKPVQDYGVKTEDLPIHVDL